MQKHNFKHELTKQENGGFLLKITLEKSEIEKSYNIILSYFSKSLEIKGFRKGQVPSEIAKKHLQEDTILGETLRELLNTSYSQVISDEKIQPVMEPQIKVLNPPLELGKNWEIEFQSSLRPTISMSADWKTKISKIKEEVREEKVKKVLASLQASSIVKLSKILLDTDMQNSQKSQKEVEGEWALNLALEEIANEQKITVDTKEVEQIMSKPENKAVNPSLIGYLLRQQKAIDYLLTL